MRRKEICRVPSRAWLASEEAYREACKLGSSPTDHAFGFGPGKRKARFPRSPSESFPIQLTSRDVTRRAEWTASI